MTKPTVFNYKNHEELRQAYKELLADNQQLIADNRKLRKEVTELKQLNDGYVKIIAKNQETNNKLMASVQKQTGGDLISRSDAIEEISKGVWNVHELIDRIKALPSADAESDDLIIKGAKGIKDGLYNITDGKLFQYKAKGGTVRTYPIVPSADSVDVAHDIPEYCSWSQTYTNMVQSAMSIPSADAISREEYEDIIKDYRKQYENMNNEIADLEAKLSADAVDCTDFIEWLVDRVLDETIWEKNSVAYGEIICRKLEKLGVLEVTEEPSYYIRPSADAVQGEWIMHGEPPWYVRECSKCGTKWHQWSGDSNPNYCGHCGARMKGGAE